MLAVGGGCDSKFFRKLHCPNYSRAEPEQLQSIVLQFGSQIRAGRGRLKGIVFLLPKVGSNIQPSPQSPDLH